MIVNVRGANGSGKSVLVKTFLDRYPYIPQFGVLGPKRPEAYRVCIDSVNLFVLGPYLTPTGGADVLSGRGFDAITSLLDKYSAKGHVLFEGVTFSVSFGQVGEWLERHKKDVIVAFLDAPLEVCVQAIKDRTGDTARFAHVREKVLALARVKKRMMGLGMRVETITRENGFEKIQGWLK